MSLDLFVLSILQKADIAIGSISITSMRDTVIDFTYPMLDSGFSILFKRSTNENKLLKIFMPLDPIVWLIISVTIVGVGVIYYILTRRTGRNGSSEHRIGLLDSMWFIYSTYQEQGENKSDYVHHCICHRHIF